MLPTSPRKRTATSTLSEWWRILAMGVLLSALIYITFLYEPDGAADLGKDPPVVIAQIATPEIDRDLLRTARDKTREERMVLEAEPLAHLLQRSLEVVPTVAKALGMPKEPVDIARLRSNPDAYRGAYLGYSGRLAYVSTGRTGHPVDGYKIYEGWVDTDEGEKVLFRVSLPPVAVEVGDWVRVEGFFLKLRDSHQTPSVAEAPLLVGPEIFPDYKRWPPVTELDRDIIDALREDAIERGPNEDGVTIELSGIRTDLASMQAPPLWHLAGYAMHRAGVTDLAHWRNVPALSTKEQLDRIRSDGFARGSEMRLLGRFIMAHTFAARPNPIGAEYWTQAWLQIRLNGKLIPVWIPGQIDPDMKRNENLEVRGYYFARLLYDTQEGKAMSPVFVAADLDRFVAPPQHPITEYAKWTFFALVLAVIGFFFWLNRRDRARRDVHEREMIARRKRRYAGPVEVPVPDSPT